MILDNNYCICCLQVNQLNDVVIRELSVSGYGADFRTKNHDTARKYCRKGTSHCVLLSLSFFDLFKFTLSVPFS